MNNKKYIELKNYEGIYKISSDGEIINSNNLILKPYKTKKGYHKISLSKDSVSKTLLIHRLIALNFIPNHENKPEVNHINGIKTDNRVENLEWCTASENHNHALNNNLINILKGENHHYSKYSDALILEIINKYKTGNYSKSDLRKEYNISWHYISLIINKKRRKYLWEK